MKLERKMSFISGLHFSYKCIVPQHFLFIYSLKKMSQSLLAIADQLTRIFLPMIMVTGIVSNILNIIVLSRPALKQHACSLYFLTLAIINLFYCGPPLIINLIADGYQIDLTIRSRAACKIISYMLNFCPCVAVYLIVAASIDRYFSSSINARTRQWSNIRTARWTISILMIILGLYFINSLMIFDISHFGRPMCGIRSDIFVNWLFLVLNIILYVIIAPLSMLLFGFLTIYNTKQIGTTATSITRYRRTEGQLSRMLLLQVGVHTILILPFCVLFCMLISTIPARYPLEFAFAFIICKLPFYLSAVTPFFLYVLSARVYRTELCRLWRKLFRMQPAIQPVTA